MGSSVHYVRVNVHVKVEYTMIKDYTYDTLPRMVKWSWNWYFIVSMIVLCLYNLITELSVQVPDTISTGWTVTHAVCTVYWLIRIYNRIRMDRATQGVE